MQKQIEQEADVITARMNDRNDYEAGKVKGFEEGYIKAGERYAEKAQAAETRADRHEKALKAILNTNHDNHERVILKVKQLANEALTPKTSTNE